MEISSTSKAGTTTWLACFVCFIIVKFASRALNSSEGQQIACNWYCATQNNWLTFQTRPKTVTSKHNWKTKPDWTVISLRVGGNFTIIKSRQNKQVMFLFRLFDIGVIYILTLSRPYAAVKLNTPKIDWLDMPYLNLKQILQPILKNNKYREYGDTPQ